MTFTSLDMFYLILSGRSDWGEAVDFVEEDDGRPHYLRNEELYSINTILI